LDKKAILIIKLYKCLLKMKLVPCLHRNLQ
jgi:hypothetical protein